MLVTSLVDRDLSRLTNTGADKASVASKRPQPRQDEVIQQQDDSWQYDGDTERPGASTDNSGAEGDSSQMRWTKKQIRKGKQAVKTHLDIPQSSAFSLGEDEDDDNTDSKSRSRANSNSRSKSPLPPDARDLVVEDSAAVEEARMKERRKGEPNTKAPVHIYRHNNPGSPRNGELEEVYAPDEAHASGENAGRRSDFIPEGEQPIVDPEEMLERIEAAPEGDTPWANGRERAGYGEEHNPWS